MDDKPRGVRDKIEPHQCVCRMVNEHGEETDRCMDYVDNPDQPFCDGCEQSGHPDFPEQSPSLEPTIRVDVASIKVALERMKEFEKGDFIEIGFAVPAPLETHVYERPVLGTWSNPEDI